MPASLKDLRSRIKSVKSTQQITKAMKLVSAAKFGRAQANVVNSRPYESSLTELTHKLAHFVVGGSAHPLMDINESKNTLVLVLSSERGLCGGYNSNMTKQAQKTIDELKDNGENVYVVGIGKKAFLSLVRRKKLEGKMSAQEEATHISEKEYTEKPTLLLSSSTMTLLSTPFDKPNYDAAEVLAESIAELYTTKKIGKLVVVYSKFQSAMSQTPTTKFILPIKPKDDYVAEPIFDPSFEELLSQVIPRYMTSQIFMALLEAVASEQGSRMTAMDNATRNAKDMERKLQITYQRARQAAITNELIEIISGAEAL